MPPHTLGGGDQHIGRLQQVFMDSNQAVRGSGGQYCCVVGDEPGQLAQRHVRIAQGVASLSGTTGSPSAATRMVSVVTPKMRASSSNSFKCTLR